MNIALLFAGILLTTGSSSPRSESEPRKLVNGLIEALNSPDSAKLADYLKAWSKPGDPTQQRTTRLSNLAKQAGPFKPAGDGKETDAEVDAFVTDRDGSRLVFMLRFTRDPDLHLGGLLVRPAYVVEGPPPAYSNWTSLDALAKQIAADTNSPAMGLAVIRDGKLEVAVAGVRKLGGEENVRPDDVWSIGSIGKSLCSTVVGALIEHGKLRWGETLSEALPGYPMDSGYSNVTLEQVMHHRGGIPQDLGFTGDQVMSIVGDAKTPEAIRDRYARNILSRKPIAAPDERFAYSNAGYALLSVAAERAAGKPYEQLLHEIVFAPLKLRHSYTDVDPLPSARPSGHDDRSGKLAPANMEGPLESMLAGAGGGLFMSVGDLATYGVAHLVGLRGQDGLLKAATIQRLHRGVPEVPNGRPYACGWSSETVPSLQAFDGHNGSNGTMRSQIAIFPEANLVVVGIVNRGGESEPAPGFIAAMAVGQRY